MRTHYQYIIVGAGCAGLQLAVALVREKNLSLDSLLIIEAAATHEEKTWCFWYPANHPFEHLVKKSWKNIAFSAPGVSVKEDLQSMRYQYISSVDFYKDQLSELQLDSRVDFLFEPVQAISADSGKNQVVTANGKISAEYIFHSQPSYPVSEKPFLWQHFLGWEIETATDVFDVDTATMMDFSLSDTTHPLFFHYILPFSSRRALVECTFFSVNLCEKEVYEQLLTQYITNYIPVPFTILSKEVGKIPMSLPAKKLVAESSTIIPIGTAAGCIKASTGYSFTRCMKHTQAIIGWLKKENEIPHPVSSKRFLFYDRLFLTLIQRYPQQMPGIFASLFKNNRVAFILQFLAEQTNLLQEALIFIRLPKRYFIKVLLNRTK
jgi:lycopene beta-cyclase